MNDKNPCTAVQSLLDIMARLRSPAGCPWDADQTPQSLAPYILEEACELIDAIEGEKPEKILDELGDLLLQVVFLAQIFSERQQFGFADVAQAIADKLVRRHPHVFAPADNGQNLDLDRQWEKIKQSEAVSAKSCLADHLPSRLPALQSAQKLINKALRDGNIMQLPDMSSTDWAKLSPGATAVTPAEMDEETLGRALFHLAGQAHQSGLDAEAALRKFFRRTLLDKVKNGD